MTSPLEPAYRSSAETLFRALTNPGSAADQAFDDHLATALSERSGRRAGKAQKRAWRNSLTALAGDLLDAGLGQVEVLVEYPMPHKPSSQADVVLAGVDRYTGGDLFIIVELKQWSSVDFYEGDEKQVVWDPKYSPVQHPALQVRGYRDQIAKFCATVKDHPDAVRGIVYLHNMPAHEARKLVGLADELKIGVFTGSDRGDLLRFLRGQFEAASGAKAADRLLDSRIEPRRDLLEQARLALKGRDGFILLDRQVDAYRAVLHAVDAAFHANSKRVVVISGGPGSGKSAIALELLAKLVGEGLRVRHATGSSAFTKTLRSHVAQGRDRAKLFTFTLDYAQTPPNEIDVLIVDEAHRSRSKSFSRYDRKKRSDRPQIESMINAARVPVFLLDENQTVAPGELGTLIAIKSIAQRLSIPFQHVALTGQWRCGGSEKYDLWVRRLLGLGDEDGAWNEDALPEAWTADPNFTVRLAESPKEMEDFLSEKLAEQWSARIAAGYCWPWSKPRVDKTLVPDVRIGDWARPWNADSLSRVGEAPPKQLWATGEGGFGQIGCIYTAQGMEYDWAGVIIGPDLVARGGRLVPERSGNLDPSLGKASPRTVPDEQFNQLVRNIYKVLLTRGLHGTVLYAVDTETQQFLRKLIPS
ncbi:DUF2075 domain-containing protein [Actinomadura sp. NPDC048394]|uniref:DUF2075 domain-containing protein n=1 Tax=Actinomadura sp. NPDC048394 TaxID=3158223 RepID=UPI0033F980DE